MGNGNFVGVGCGRFSIVQCGDDPHKDFTWACDVFAGSLTSFFFQDPIYARLLN